MGVGDRVRLALCVRAVIPPLGSLGRIGLAYS